MASEAIEMKPQDAAAKAASAAPKGGDKLGMLVFLIVVLNTVAAGGMGYLLMQLSGKVAAFESKAKELEAKMSEEKKPQSPLGKEFIPQDLGVMYPLEPFLVNITSDRGPRFLQMKMELELETPALEDEIALKRPALRDAVIVLLTSRNYAELRDPNGMKKLRVDILRAMNNLLKSGQIKEVYFTQFHFN